MSKKALVPTNLLTSTTDPTVPTLRSGDLYYNTTTGRVRAYSGSAWADVGGGAGNYLTVSPSGGTLTTAAVAPTSPATSDLWIDTSTSSTNTLYWVNVVDYGADPTGAVDSTTAINNAIASLPNGGVVWFPVGTYLITTVLLNVAHVVLRGASRYASVLKTNSTTADMIQVSQYYNVIEDLNFQGPNVTSEVPSRTAGYAINGNTGSGFPAYTKVRRCTFTYQYNCINQANQLFEIDDLEFRHFKNVGIVVNHTSDQQISNVTMDNNNTVNTPVAGIQVLQCGSLLLDSNNIIHSGACLDIAPGSGVTVPSVKGINNFFDSSAYGLRMTTAGSFLRSEFTNCWFGSQSTAGIALTPAVGGQADGISFVSCDVYNNVAGTTTGFLTNAQTKGWTAQACNFAGWTTGISLVPGANHFPRIHGCKIGSVAAFGVNTTGITVTAGTFLGMVISGNDLTGSTTALTLGAVTVATWTQYRITDNVGVNPRGNSVATPATPAAGATVTNQTGFKVLVMVKYGVTAPAGVVIHSVNFAQAGLANQHATFVLEPGMSITFTTNAPSAWSWIGM